MVVAILTGHAPVRGHLYIMGLFDGDPTCRFCRMETETVQHITCCCEVLARQRYNVFGKLIVEPKDISTASVRDLCLYKRHRVIVSVLNECLGLYIMPKGDVHPGHKLTGPKEEECLLLLAAKLHQGHMTGSRYVENGRILSGQPTLYSDTSANKDNSFRNHIR